MRWDSIKELKNLSLYKAFLTGPISTGKLRFLMIYFGVISVLEILAYLYQGLFSVVSSRLWLFTGAVCLITILAYLFWAILFDILKNKYFTVLSFVILIIFLISVCGNINLSEINPDAAQQAAAGLDSFRYKDLNYTGTAFLNYPNRQYILAALPALLFGRSIFTLHLGFAFPFILGVIILYCALRKWARKLGLDTNLAVLPLFILFVFPFTAEYYTNFEQTIYPMSFGMIVAGFFLLVLFKPNVINIICTAWAGCLLCNTYTPALALLGLFLIFVNLAALQWVRKPEAMPFDIVEPVLAAEALLLVEGNGMLFFIATLLRRGQESLIGIQKGVNLFKLSYNSIYDFLVDKNAAFLGMFGIVVLVYLFMGLTFRLKLRDFLIALWTLGVFAASYLMTGYIDYQPAWIMQRALIVIPVIIVGISLALFDYLASRNIRINTGFTLIVILSTALIGWSNFNRPNQSFIYFNYIQPVKYMLKDVESTVRENGLEPTSDFNLLLYSEDALIRNPADYCRFLFPNARVYVPDIGILPEDVDLSLDTFIYGDVELTGLPVQTQEVIDYKNRKHDIEGTWYKASLVHE